MKKQILSLVAAATTAFAAFTPNEADAQVFRSSVGVRFNAGDVRVSVGTSFNTYAPRVYAPSFCAPPVYRAPVVVYAAPVYRAPVVVYQPPVIVAPAPRCYTPPVVVRSYCPPTRYYHHGHGHGYSRRPSYSHGGGHYRRH